MRKRNLMIGAVVGVAGSLAIAGVVMAAVDSQTYNSTASKTKQDKKVRGPVGNFVTNVDTIYSGPPGAQFTPPATQTVLTFDRDFKFTPGTLPQCNLASLTGKDAAGARAACPRSQVGQGTAVIRTLAGGTLNAIVSAFNGARTGGNPTIYLHTDVQGSTTKPILTGTLQGNTLIVQVPVTPGTAITHFDTTINQVVSQKKKKTLPSGKKKTVNTFYVSAKCSGNKRWDHTETTTFNDGTTKSASFSQPCKQKKKK
jgi:hypothetical protein